MRPYVHGLIVDLEAALETVPKRAARPVNGSLANERIPHFANKGVATRREHSPVAG